MAPLHTYRSEDDMTAAGERLEGEDDHGGRGGRERGNALLTVLILTVGIIAMLTFLFGQESSNSRSQFESRRHIDVDLALRSAMADAAAEIANSLDLTNGGTTADGLGAKGTLLIAGTDTSTTHTVALRSTYGIALVSSVNASDAGRTMARYMTTIDASDMPDSMTLNVVAAYPDFANPDIVKAAKVRFTPSFIFGDRNAVTFAGGMDVGGSGSFGITDDHQCHILIEVPDDSVPAMNVSSSALSGNNDFEDFIDDILGLGGFSGVEGRATGADPLTAASELADPSQADGSGSGWDTISGYPSDRIQLSDTVLAQIAQDVRGFYENGVSFVRLKGDSNGGKTFTTNAAYDRDTGTQDHDLTDLKSDGSGHTGDSATETFYLLEDTANIQTDITGSGTLVIDNNNITFENGAVINWTGNVLLYGDNSSISMTINNANVNINGKLIIVPDPSNNKEGNLLMKGSGSGVGGGIEDDSECVLNVGGLPGSDGGSLMAIAAGTSKIEMHLTTGPNMEAPRMHVEGVALYLGSNLDILFDGIDSGGSPHLEYGVTSYAGAKNWGSGAVGDGSEHMTHLKVEGSMVIAGPAGSTLQKLDFGEHLNVRLMFDNDNYEDAVDGIKEISPNISAWVQAGYYELGADVTSGDSAKALLADMLTKIETAAGASQEIGVGQ